MRIAQQERFERGSKKTSSRTRKPAASRAERAGKVLKRSRSRQLVPRSVLALREYVRLADERWKEQISDGPGFVHDFLSRVAEPAIRERLAALLLEHFPLHVKSNVSSVPSGGSQAHSIVITDLGWREARKALYNMKLEQWVD